MDTYIDILHVYIHIPHNTIIAPNIRVCPVWWTYANVCIRSRMIRNIRFNFFFLFFGLFFYIHNSSQTNKSFHTHPLSLTHTRTCRIRVYNDRIHTFPLDSPSLGYLCK